MAQGAHPAEEGQLKALADHSADACLGPDCLGTVVRFVGVNRYIGSPRRKDAQDRNVEIHRARRNTNPDAVSCADIRAPQATGYVRNPLAKGLIAQQHRAVIQRRSSRVPRDCFLDDVHQGPGRGRRRYRENSYVRGVLLLLGRKAWGNRAYPRAPRP